MQHLPTRGPVILVCNTHTFNGSLQLVSATDRLTRVLLLEDSPPRRAGLLRRLARRTSLFVLRPGQLSTEVLETARRIAQQTLADGHLLAVSIDGPQIEALIVELQRSCDAPVVPVFVGALNDTERPARVRVVFGEVLTAPPELAEVRKAIEHLGDWVRKHDEDVAALSH
jgi:hypothetical protein